MQRRKFIKYGMFAAAGGVGTMAVILSRKSRSYHQVITPDADTQLLLPDHATRIIVYCHGNGEDRTAPKTDTVKWPLIKEMLANGWTVLSVSAGNTWGNAASISQYQSAITWAKTTYGISAVDLFSQSMGGCTGLQIFAADSTISHWLGIYPVCSLANMRTTSFASEISASFSANETEMTNKDPMNSSNSFFTGRKMWLDASADDTIVNKTANATALYNKLNGIANITYNQTPTGEHGDPSHFIIDDIIEFLRT